MTVRIGPYNGASALGTVVGGLAGGAAQALARAQGHVWQVTRNDLTTPLLKGCLILSMNYQARSQLAQAPVSNSRFTVYNHVLSPATGTVTFMVPASMQVQQAARRALDEANQDQSLIYVLERGIKWPSMGVIGYSLHRTQNSGASLCQINVNLSEILVAGDVVGANTRPGYEMGRKDVGTVVPQESDPLTVGGLY